MAHNTLSDVNECVVHPPSHLEGPAVIAVMPVCQRSDSLRNQSGMVLVTALVLLAMLIVFAATSIQWATQDVVRTEQYNKSRDSFYIAMAGIENAINHLNYSSTGSSPGEEIAAAGMDTVLSSFLTNHSALTSTSYNGGTYAVSLADNDDNDGNTADDSDNTLILTSVGSKSNRSITIKAVIHRPLYEAKNAITTQGNLNANGNITVNGTAGSVHTNSSFTQAGGSAFVAQGVTSTGTCSGSECVSGGMVPEDIPTITPADFKSYCDFWLHSDGTITNAAGGALAADKDLSSWSYNSGQSKWSLNGASENGMYYVDGKVVMTGNISDVDIPGNSDPLQATFLATEYIKIGGTVSLKNYRNPSHTEDIQNLFLVATKDVDLGSNVSIGSAGNPEQGIIGAGHQLGIAGNTYIKGYAVASDVADTGTGADNPVSGDSTISGNMTITYDNQTTGPWLSNKVIILSWEETG